jgi:hypothetical protein
VRVLAVLASIIAVGCSGETVSSRVVAGSGQSRADSSSRSDREVVPAEWTVAEDTAANGEVTTASVQLPTSRTIDGLPADQPTRLILQCLDGRVAAFIAPSEDDAQGDSTPSPAPVRVALDSAPPCE